jgi:hypothetical protein
MMRQGGIPGQTASAPDMPKGGHPVRNGVTALQNFRTNDYWLYGP